MIVNWVLNPGLAVNELLLGQRIPKITYFCKSCGNDTTYVRYYQCPECQRFHEEAIWTGNTSFGHWFGMICPDCGGEIPCVLNLVSWGILTRLSPVNWVLRLMFGRKYVTWEQHRAANSRRHLEAQRCQQAVSAESIPQEVIDCHLESGSMDES